MNCLYRVIWNHALGLFQCVSELTRVHGKTSRNRTVGSPVVPSASRAPRRLPHVVLTGLSTALLLALTPGAHAQTYTIDANNLTSPPFDVWRDSTKLYSGSTLTPQGNGTLCISPCDKTSNHVRIFVNPGDVITFGPGTHFQANQISWANASETGTNPQVIVESGAKVSSVYRGYGFSWTSTSRTDLWVKQGGVYEITNPEGHQNDAHFFIGGSGAADIGNTTTLVEGELNVAHMLALAQLETRTKSATTTLTVTNGGSVKTIGLKLGASNDQNQSLKTINLNVTDGGKITVSAFRGIAKTSANDAYKSTKNIVAHIKFDGGTIAIDDSTAKGYNFKLKSAENATLFRFVESGPEAHEAGYQDSIEIGTKGMRIRTDGVTYIPSQYRGASFSGSGTLTKTGVNPFVITASNAEFTGKVEILEGTLEVGGAGLLNNANTHDFSKPLTDWAISAALKTPTNYVQYTQQSGIGTGTVNIAEGATLVLSPDRANYGYADEVYHFNNGITGEGDLAVITRETILIDGIYGGQARDFHGSTRVEAGHLIVSGDGTRFENATGLTIGSLYEGIDAKLTLKNLAEFAMDDNSTVMIGEKGDGTLVLDKAKLFATGTIKHGAAKAYGTRTKANVTMENGSTLAFTADGYFMEDFDVTRGDTIASTGGEAGYNTIEVAEGKTQRQTNTAKITTSGTVVKTGKGTFEIQASNLGLTTASPTSGVWRLKEGTLALGNKDSSQAYADVVGAGQTIDTAGTLDANGVASASLRFNFKDTYTFSPSLLTGNQNVNLVKGGTGTMVLNENQTYTGLTQIRGGTLSVQDGATSLAMALGTSTSAIDTGNEEEKGVLEFRRTADESLSRSITGTGDVVKADDGRLTLMNATYDYTGKTQVRGGELYLANGKAITQTAQVEVGAESVNSAATFTLEGSATVHGQVLLAQGAKGNSMNTLHLDGATLAANNILRGTSEGEDNKIRLLGEHAATVVFTLPEGTSAGTSVTQTLFEGFNTDKGDKIEVGSGGMTWSVAKGLRLEQASSAVITSQTEATDSSLTITGEGTLVLAAKNTYSGTLTVDTATLEWGNGGSRINEDIGGTEAVVLTNGATLAINLSDADFAFEDNQGATRLVTGHGNLVQKGTGTTTVDDQHTYDGTTTILGGTLRLQMERGQLGTGTSAVVTGVDEKKGTFELETNSNHTYSRLVTGTGNLRKTGSGVVTIDTAGAGNYDYTGDTFVNAGELVLATENHITRTDNLIVSAEGEGVSDARFTIKGTATVRDVVKLGDTGTNAASLSVLRLDGATLSAAHIVSNRPEGSNAKVGFEFRKEATVNVTETGTLFSGFNTSAGDRIQVGDLGGTISVADGKVATQAATAALTDLDGPEDATPTNHNVVKVGTGTLVLNARNAYSGTLSVTDGTLTLGDGARKAGEALLGGTGDIALTQGTLRLNVLQADGAVSTFNDGERVNARGDYVLARRLTQVGDAPAMGNLVKAGSGRTILTAANDYQGTTTIEDGVLQVGDVAEGSTASTATLGGTGDITLESATSRLAYGLTDDFTLTRKLTGAGSIEQSGTGTLTVDNTENDFTGDVYATSGTLLVKRLTALGPVGKTTHLGRLDASASVSDTASTAPVTRVRRVRALTASSSITEPTTAQAPGTLVLDLAENAQYDYATDGNGSLVKRGAGSLRFTNDYTYVHSGETRLEGGKLVLGAGVDMPNADLRLTDGELLATPETHRVRAFHVEASEGSPKTTIFVNDFTTYTNYHASGDVAIQGGELYIDLRQYEADFEATRTGNLMPNVIQADGDFAVGSAFTSYSDSSVLFNFTPVYDVDGTLVPSVGTHAMHLVVSAEHQTTCSAPGMGAVECIVRNHAHDHAAPMAEVLDREFRDNPAGNVAQHFYSVSSEQLVDEMAERGLPLMTGSINQTLGNDAQALALYAPRDPCDPTVTEHGSHLWTQLDKAWGDQDAYRGSTGYRTRSTGVALGHDVCSKDHLSRYGAYVGYRNTDVMSRQTAALHSADTRLLQVGLYGDRVVAENQDIDWQVGYGRGFVKGARTLSYLGYQAKSQYDANIAYAGVGYNWRGDVVSPFVRFDYTYVRSDAYHETGAEGFNYDVAAQTRHSGVASLGYQFKGHPTENLMLRGRVALGVELLNEHNTIRTAFEGIPGATFDTRSAEDERVQATLDFGLRYRVTKSVDVDLGYQALFKPDYTQQTGEARLTVTF